MRCCFSAANVGRQEYFNGIKNEEKAKADLFEAILGGIFLATGGDAEILEKAVVKMLSLEKLLDEVKKEDFRLPQFSLNNSVNTLKEMWEKGLIPKPEFSFSSPDNLGYNENGDPIWCCRYTIQSLGIIRQVWAHSKKDAKKCAAYLVLCDHFELQNEYGKNGKFKDWEYCDGKLNPSGSSNREFIPA